MGMTAAMKAKKRRRLLGLGIGFLAAALVLPAGAAETDYRPTDRFL